MSKQGWFGDPRWTLTFSCSADTGTILYKLPGHTGTCTAVALHPKEPIGECEERVKGGKESPHADTQPEVISCSTDRTMLLGEIEP